jgi:uncharacterized damage-inducible protein DinB
MRPDKTDYAPFYAGYVDALEGDNGIDILVSQSTATQELLNSFSEAKGNYAYAEGKWTVKEVVGHLIDAERIFAYRALCIARGEKKSLPGFEQNDYVATGNFNSRQLFDLNYEFRLLRESNILMFKGFNEFMLNQRGIANDKEVTVRALLFITAGHEKHHMKVLKERYQDK